MTVSCPYCDRPAVLKTGRDMYPHRADLHALRFWCCDPCGAHVGCHKPGNFLIVEGRKITSDGTLPFGRLANAELRSLKMEAHRAFDRLWHFGELTRHNAYRWLAHELGVSIDTCHIGMMDEEGCRTVIELCGATSARKVAKTARKLA